MEATYTPGDGLVVGAGSRWLLASTAPDAATVETLWTLLTGPRPDAAAVLDVARAGCGPDAAVVLVDLTVGAESSLTHGAARHRTLDGVHTLDLGAAPSSTDAVLDRPGRRLVGGVVAASRLELRPAARGVRPVPAVARPGTTPAPADGAPAATAAAAPGPAPAGLIDGIPSAILAATAPTPVPASVVPVETDEPPADAPRLVERMGLTHTVRRDLDGASRPPGPPPTPSPTPPATAADDPDHDGQTTYRPADIGAPPPPPPGAHLRQATHETVLAVHCPAGHVTAAFSPRCRVCHEPVAPQEPHRMPRPRLGTLHLPDGERVPLDRGVVLGRQPEPVPGTDDWPHLVRLPHDATYVSRSHLSVVLDGWLVLATDLGSRGGTTLRVAGRPPQRIRGHEQYVWEPGQVLDLADSYEIVYSVDGADGGDGDP